METAAYYVALVMVVAIPGVVPCWLLIHPFAEKWRKIGAFTTYLIVCSIGCAIMIAMYLVREPLLMIRFGVRMPLVILAGLLFAIGIYLGILRMRHLSPSTMLGLPEISRTRGPGRLVTEGIYSCVRHPRYLEGGFAIAAAALFSNYLAAYLLIVFYIVLIYLVIILEERELKRRFGTAYEEYCKKVPRFVPRLRRTRGVRVND